MKVTCIHIGARAHYLLPKAIQKHGKLGLLITDTWISSPTLRAIFSKIPINLIKSFAGRYTCEIPLYRVKTLGLKFFVSDIGRRLRYKNDWRLIIARNNSFQEQA